MMRKNKSRREALKLVANTGVVGGFSLYSKKAATVTAKKTDSQIEQINKCPSITSIERPTPSAWPQKRYDATASGYNPDANGPTSPDTSIKWRFEGGHGKILTPIMANGTVYALRSYPDADLTAINLESGDSVWQQTYERQAYTPPVIRNETVYAGFGNATVQANEEVSMSLHPELKKITALTLAGESVLVGTGAGDPTVTAVNTSQEAACWKATLSEVAHEVTGIAAEAGAVFVSAYGRKTDHPDIGVITALDPSTGETLWEAKTIDPAFGVSVSDGTTFVRTESSVHALDADTGDSNWKFDTNGGSHAPPTVANGTVLFGDLFEAKAVDSSSGQLKWRHETRARNVRLVVASDTVYFTSDAVSDYDARIGALAVESGEELWSERLGSYYLSSPIVGEETVLVSAQTPGVGAPGQDSYEPEMSELIAYK